MRLGSASSRLNALYISSVSESVSSCLCPWIVLSKFTFFLTAFGVEKDISVLVMSREDGSLGEDGVDMLCRSGSTTLE